jgi:hypothetical protein
MSPELAREMLGVRTGRPWDFGKENGRGDAPGVGGGSERVGPRSPPVPVTLGGPAEHHVNNAAISSLCSRTTTFRLSLRLGVS